MYYVVCVKMVPDTTQVKIDPVTNTLIREGSPSSPIRLIPMRSRRRCA